MEILTSEVLTDKFVFLEGPRWHNGRLYTSDIWGEKVYAVSEAGEREVIVDVPTRPSGLGWLPDDTMIIVSMADRKLMRWQGGELVTHADLSQLAGGDLNDMVVDDQGRAYVGNMGYDIFNREPYRTANIIMVSPDGDARVVAEDMGGPNGPVITSDGKTLVVAETANACLTAFDITADGGLENRRIFADLGDRRPDGICLDVEGGIWVADFSGNQFVRVEDGGEITHQVNCRSRRAVACQLGGADMRTLFCLTSDGTLRDVGKGGTRSQIETVAVESAGAGSP